MAVQLPTRPKPMVTAGYSMPAELRDAIAAAAEEVDCSASAMVVAVMTDYLEKTTPTKRGKK